MIKVEHYPKFTVLIPQKNRKEYLYHTIRTCMLQDYPNLEILVLDDCSDDGSVEMVKDLQVKDNRIKLVAHTEHLGMRDNFEYGLNLVTEGYVMTLGGDDGLVPGCILRMFEFFNQYPGQELLSWAPAGFTYPDDDQDANIFYFDRLHSKRYSAVKNTEEFLRDISNSFNYQTKECPMLFMKSVVSVDVIKRIRLKTRDGSFYYCSTPDGFSGVIMSFELESYIYTNEHLSIVGSTTKSQGRRYSKDDEESRSISEQFIKDNEQRKMHELLGSQPYSPLITLMTADFLLTCMDFYPDKAVNIEINLEKLLLKSFSLIGNNQANDAIIERELLILREIARAHNLMELYNRLLKNTKRRIYLSKEVKGNAITNSWRLNGIDFGINNIFDASIALPFALNLRKTVKISLFLQVIYNSSRILIREINRKKIGLPKI